MTALRRLSSRAGITLVELMIVIGVTSIICLFAFDSVRQVITASMGAGHKVDFESLNNDVRFLVSRLDQCTCNFYGQSLTTNNAAFTLPLTNLSQFATPQGPPCANPIAPALITTGASRQDGLQIQRIDLTNIQYMKLMNVARARLRVQALVPQQTGQNARTITRYYPVMFSTNPVSASTVTIKGCIGMTD